MQPFVRKLANELISLCCHVTWQKNKLLERLKRWTNQFSFRLILHRFSLRGCHVMNEWLEKPEGSKGELINSLSGLYCISLLWTTNTGAFYWCTEILWRDPEAHCCAIHPWPSPHVARICTQFLEAETIPVLAWLAYSLDMSHIEHVWDALDRRIQQRVPVPANIQQLRTAIEEEWTNIPQATINNLINSMRRRCGEWWEHHIVTGFRTPNTVKLHILRPVHTGMNFVRNIRRRLTPRD